MKKEGKLSVYLVFAILVGVLFVVLVLAAPSFHTPGTTSYLEEDQSPVFTYNFTANVTNPENDTLTFSITEIKSGIHSSTNASFYSWITINATSGVMTINSTLDNETGQHNISVRVLNTVPEGQTSVFYFIVNATNDAPNFTNIDIEYNLTQDENFVDYLNATDEESHYPLYFDINFTSCSLASWSTREAGNCTLFSVTNVTNISAIMNFTPIRNDVGTYYANISVRDYGENYSCPYTYCATNYSQNKTTYYTQNVTFNVFANLFINATDCQNAVFQENQSNTCQVNITSRGPDDTLNISSLAILRNFPSGNISNISWFFANVSTNAVNNIKTIDINMAPQKTEIGNWTINFTVQDITFGLNSTKQIYIYVNRTLNDAPELTAIANFKVSTNQTKIINLTVYDDDLLIPDKEETGGGYNETITFNVTILNQSDLSQELNISGFDVEIVDMPISGTNRTEAKIEFTPNSSEIGNYTINITINDKEDSTDFEMFNLTIFGNGPPVWNDSMSSVFTIWEDNKTYLNFTQNITDSGGDSLTFTFTNDSRFDAFVNGFNLTTGIANFTPSDVDVGYHNVTITVSDGYLSDVKEFNFTVYNINDAPSITTPIDEITNATGDSGVGINVTEDNYTTIRFFVTDGDYNIPSNQKSFYNEVMVVNLTIEGPNTALFSFSEATPSFPSGGQTRFDTSFTPNKTDVGGYNITINVTDANGVVDSVSFNLTVFETRHAPVMTQVGNQVFSILEAIYLDINTTDLEDINETAPGSNLTYTLTNLTVDGNFLTINSTTGIINFTFNQTYAGIWEYNVSVNDSAGLMDFEIFNITVYDYPVVLLPLSSFEFNFKENVSYQLNFTVNHTVQNNLTYTLIINNVIRNITSGNGNGTEFLWNFTANFTDETTCTGTINLTLNVSNSKLSNSSSWNLTINHTNYPLSFGSDISDISSGSPASVTLSDHFTDMDASDSCRNQTIGFVTTLISGSGISTSITNWTNASSPSVTFSASASSSANYSITGFEFTNSSYNSSILRNDTSNNFSVTLTVTTRTTPVSSTGGGSTTVKQISLNIIVVGPISAKKRDRVVIPIQLVNDGEIDLREIVLDATIEKDEILRTDLTASFDESLIDSLLAGERENVTMTVDINTEDAGTFEITVNATVKNPEYNDLATIYIDIEEGDIMEKIFFVEEFIVGNPECAEIKELLDEAKSLHASGDIRATEAKLDEALSACERAISQPSRFSLREGLGKKVFNYVGFASLIAFILGLVYYQYKRYRLKKAMSEISQSAIYTLL